VNSGRRTLECLFKTIQIVLYVMPTGTGVAASCNLNNIWFPEVLLDRVLEDKVDEIDIIYQATIRGF